MGEVVIENEGGLREALSELGKLDVLIRRRSAKIDKEIRAVYDLAGALEVEVSGEKISADVRVKQLQDAIISFAQSKQDELLAERSGKSLVYPEGSISFKTVAATLAIAEGLKPEDVIAKADKLSPFTESIKKLIEKVKLFGVGFLELFEVSFKPSLASVKRVWLAGRLKPAEVKKLGFQVVPEYQSVSVKLPEVSID